MPVTALNSSCESGLSCMVELEPFLTRAGEVAGFVCVSSNLWSISEYRYAGVWLSDTLRKILYISRQIERPHILESSEYRKDSFSVFLHIDPGLIMDSDIYRLFEHAAVTLERQGVRLGLVISASSLGQSFGYVCKLKSSMYLLADVGVRFMIEFEDYDSGWEDGFIMSYLGTLVKYVQFRPEWFGILGSRRLTDLDRYKKNFEVLSSCLHSRDVVFFCSGIRSAWQLEAISAMPFRFFSGDALSAGVDGVSDSSSISY